MPWWVLFGLEPSHHRTSSAYCVVMLKQSLYAMYFALFVCWWFAFPFLYLLVCRWFGFSLKFKKSMQWLFQGIGTTPCDAGFGIHGYWLGGWGWHTYADTKMKMWKPVLGLEFMAIDWAVGVGILTQTPKMKMWKPAFVDIGVQCAKCSLPLQSRFCLLLEHSCKEDGGGLEPAKVSIIVLLRSST